MADVVADAVASFRDSNDGGDSLGMDSMGNAVFNAADTAEPLESAGGDVAEAGDPTPDTTQEKVDAAVDAGATQDEIDKILEAEGVKPPQQGQRENRIPYSQVKRITTNAQKKWQAEADAKFATERQQFEQTQARLKQWEAAENLAATDPERYLRTLAQLNPDYQRFLQPITDQVAAKADAKDADPEPQPTLQADGSYAFTTEQWKAHQAWERRQAVQEATAALEAKLKPVLEAERERQARADGERIYNERLAVVKSQVQRLNETYGADVVKKHEEAIVAEMQKAEAVGYMMPMAEAAMIVLTPVLRAEANKQRQTVLNELKGRPAAASGQVASAQKGDAEDAGPRTVEDAIKESLRRFRAGRATV